MKYPASIAIKLESNTREAVERLADQQKISLGEAARELLGLGIKARAGAEI